MAKARAHFFLHFLQFYKVFQKISNLKKQKFFGKVILFHNVFAYKANVGTKASNHFRALFQIAVTKN